jgi:hypothetical protein
MMVRSFHLLATRFDDHLLGIQVDPLDPNNYLRIDCSQGNTLNLHFLETIVVLAPDNV